MDTGEMGLTVAVLTSVFPVGAADVGASGPTGCATWADVGPATRLTGSGVECPVSEELAVITGLCQAAALHSIVHAPARISIRTSGDLDGAIR